jgi:MSHA biogenesis protein MshP
MMPIQQLQPRFTRQAQRGFAIISAIFLLVTLAALGAFMLTFSNTQHLTSAQDVQGSRAYWATRAGMEWGITSVNPVAPVCPISPTTFNVNTGNIFSVTVTCTMQTYSEASSNANMLSFISTARTTGAVGSVGYIERSVSSTIEYDN